MALVDVLKIIGGVTISDKAIHAAKEKEKIDATKV